MTVTFQAPCPDCGEPCEWREDAQDGYAVAPPVFEVHCDCRRTVEVGDAA